MEILASHVSLPCAVAMMAVLMPCCMHQVEPPGLVLQQADLAHVNALGIWDAKACTTVDL